MGAIDYTKIKNGKGIELILQFADLVYEKQRRILANNNSKV